MQLKSVSLKRPLLNIHQARYVLPPLISLLACICLIGCKKNFVEQETQTEVSDRVVQNLKPNVIIFIADDLGYEIPTFTGGQSYSTPNLDFMAANGIQFSKCYSHPDGYPSRLALYTGKYNFRNYTKWGQLPTTEKTIGNLLHDAGYATCFVGKWDCDGGDTRIRSAGYDKYRVFLPFAYSGKDYQYSYKNPKLYEDGNYLGRYEWDR